jgi:TRAP transporter TAXI family solute receptor
LRKFFFSFLPIKAEKEKRRIEMKYFTRTFAVACLIAGAAQAAGFDLPEQVSWTTYASEPLVHDQVVAIGAALKDAAGVDLRIEPANTDAARTDLLRRRQVDFSATAVGGSVAAQEGAFDFGGKDWGPQKLRLVLANNSEPIDYAIAVAGDSGVRTYADLKGKRVAWYTGFPIVNVNTQAYLAYGGLTWDDVERVDVDGFFDSGMKALAEGKLDAAFGATTDPASYDAAAGKRGLFWPAIDETNAEGLKRMNAVAPYFVPYTVTEGAAIDPKVGEHSAHYAYPILVAMENTDPKLVHNMAKALVELYPQYADKAPGIDGWKVDVQALEWFVPYHEGAVAYFKELGVWSDHAQAHNDGLIARQEALAAAWKALAAENPADWDNAWAERRRQALKDGGFQVIF